MNIPVTQIDKGVPAPLGAKYPVNQLEVGESFVFPLTARQTVSPLASKIKKLTGKTFTIRKFDDGNARIWRLT